MQMTSERFNKLLRLSKSNRLEMSGDAFTEIYLYLRDNIIGYMIKRYQDEEFAKDIAHDFFRKLLTAEITYKIEFPFAWSYAVCENIAKDYFKKETKCRKACVNAKFLTTPDNPFNEIVFKEYLENLKDIDPAVLEIITLKTIHKFTFKEISDKLNEKSGTVRQKYARGLIKLKEIFKKL